MQNNRFKVRFGNGVHNTKFWNRVQKKSFGRKNTEDEWLFGKSVDGIKECIIQKRSFLEIIIC